MCQELIKYKKKRKQELDQMQLRGFAKDFSTSS